jgi:hypothetical protein
MSDAVDSILEQIAELSFSEMLQLNASLALLIKKEGKGGAVGRAVKKDKKAKDPDAPKRQAATGTLAWIAFVKKIKEEHPDLFVDCTREPERLAIVKDYRAENMEEYKDFVKTFKEDADEAGSEEEDEAPAPPVKKAAPAKKTAAAAPKTPAPVEKKEDKLAAVRALAEAKKKAAAAKPAEKKEAPPKKEVKKTVAAKTAPAPAEEEDDESMGKITVDGTEYWVDKKTNGLYTLEEGDGFGPWVGYYQPETKDIRHTDAPEEE